MLKNGNSNVAVCVLNLLRTKRGTVPYERTKGIDGRLIDKPSELAVTKLIADAEEMIKEFEPRAAGISMDVKKEMAHLGYFNFNANFRERG